MKGDANSKSNVIEPGGVDEYIKKCPKDIQPGLQDIRSAIRLAAPGATETLSYFQMPGYSYAGYDYNGMFAWFSFKGSYVRLHVRPPVLNDNNKHLGDYSSTKAVISFPANKAIYASASEVIRDGLRFLDADQLRRQAVIEFNREIRQHCERIVDEPHHYVARANGDSIRI